MHKGGNLSRFFRMRGRVFLDILLSSSLNELEFFFSQNLQFDSRYNQVQKSKHDKAKFPH